MVQIPAVLGAGTEGIKNGGFDSAEGWSTSSTAIIENGALRLTGSANTASSQLVSNVVGGSTYTFRAKYKTTGVAGAAITVAFRVPSGWDLESYAFTGSEIYKSFKSKSKEAYDSYALDIKVPLHTTQMSVQLRRVNGATGEVYWDDVSLTGTFKETLIEENPFKADAAGTAELSLDEVFYYTEKTTATATVKAGLSADKVTYSLYEGNTKKWDKTENYGKAFSFSLSELKQETKYRLTAKVKKGASAVAEGEQIFYRVRRPTALSADGSYYPVTVDAATGSATKAETPMQPIFLYTVNNANFATAASGGINVIAGYASVLNDAAKAGIKVLVVLYSASPKPTGTSMLPAGHPNNVAATRATINRYKHHEAVFGWMVMDEPYYNLVSREAGPQFEEAEVNTWLLNSYRVIHEEDPHHPVFIMQDSSSHYRQAARGVDILGIDPYIPQKGDVWRHVYDMTSIAEEATKGEKPVYSLLQAFRWYNFMPNANQIRHMVYQARLAGAEAVGYYKFNGADGSQNLSQLSAWDGVLRVKAERDILFGLGKGTVRDNGIYGETKDGKGVLLHLGNSAVKVLTATYSADSPKELIKIDFTSLSQTENMEVYNSTKDIKRFIWTDGQGLLAPSV